MTTVPARAWRGHTSVRARGASIALRACSWATALLCAVLTGNAVAQEIESQKGPPEVTGEAAEQGHEAAWPPAYEAQRFREDWQPYDWSALAELSRDFTDGLKVVSLNSANTSWIGFGGQLRLRYLSLQNSNFGGADSASPALWTVRPRLFADLHLGRHVRAYVEGIGSYTGIDDSDFTQIGQGSPVDDGDLLNAFLELRTAPDTPERWDLGAWVGRREQSLGRERMISGQEWLFSRRSYQGAGVFLERGTRRFEAAVYQPVIVVPDAFNTSDDATTIWQVVYRGEETTTGAYDDGNPTAAATASAVHWEPYVIGAHRKQREFVAGTENEDRYTVGLLSYADIGDSAFDYEFEGMFQFGRFGSGDITAFSVTAQVGYEPRWDRYARLWGSFDYASGDSDPGDDTLGTFDPLFPAAINFFGLHGILERKNLVAVNANIDLQLTDDFFVRPSFWQLWRAEIADGMYSTAGGILRAPGGSQKRDLGRILQVAGAWVIDHHFMLAPVLTYWWPGSFQGDTQVEPTKNMLLLALSAQVDF